MVMWVDHRAANIEDDWLGFPFVAEMRLAKDRPDALFFFATDYGRGERLFKLTLEPQNFGNLARAMMQADRDAATAAFSDAFCRAYPLSSDMKFMMGTDDE